MTIKEASEQSGLSQDTLRYYERIKILPTIKRNQSGYRDYSENDCNWIYTMKWMRKAGMSIELLIEYVALAHQGDETSEARKQLLVTQREELAGEIQELNSTLELLNKKITTYEERVLRNTQNLVENSTEEQNKK